MGVVLADEDVAVESDAADAEKGDDATDYAQAGQCSTDDEVSGVEVLTVDDACQMGWVSYVWL